MAYILGSPLAVSTTFGAILNISMPSANGYFLKKKRVVAQSDFYPEGMWGMGRQVPSSSLGVYLVQRHIPN